MALSENQTSKAFRDIFFRHLFHDPKRAIELCNALVDADYPDDTPVEFLSLETDTLMARFNDVAFTVGEQLIVMVEHQSTINPNMPLRFLGYIWNTLNTKLKTHDSLFAHKRMSIPTPRFFVLYNGKGKLKERESRLSDAFMRRDDNPSLELTVTAIDINRNNGEEVLVKSQSLYAYASLITEIEERMAAEIGRDRAIREAVQYCVEHNILAQYLKENFEEVCKMLGMVYDKAAEARVLKEEGRQEEKISIVRKMLALSMPVADISKVTGFTEEEIQKLLN